MNSRYKLRHVQNDGGHSRVVRAALLLLQCTFAGCALLLAAWLRLPWLTLVGLALMGVCAMMGLRASSDSLIGIWCLRLARTGMVTAALGLLQARSQLQTFDAFFAVIPWLFCATLMLPEFGHQPATKRDGWRALAVIFAFAGNGVWLGLSYQRNLAWGFHLSLLLTLMLLFVIKAWFRIRPWALQVVNTLIVVVVGLPTTDLILSPAEHFSVVPSLSDRPWTPEFASKDPAAYARWWRYYSDEWPGLFRDIFSVRPVDQRQYQLIPGAKTRFCQSDIAVNTLGFRGREIAVDKGAGYRVVALGESTTWGITLAANDRPWPEVLEELISRRMNLPCPVEVINAGVPSINLRENLDRLETQILPLKPDLVISYHGFNGFTWLDPTLPPVRSTLPPPKYQPRPLKLLADAEYGWKVLKFRKELTKPDGDPPVAFQDPHATTYAEQYRRLIEIARTNRIQLALATYSMAVNADSTSEVTGFYHHMTPALHRQIKTHELHNRIVTELAERNPDIILVDTLPVLDGRHHYFIDLVHFTQEGRDLMAETVFAAIRPALEKSFPRPATAFSSSTHQARK